MTGKEPGLKELKAKAQLLHPAVKLGKAGMSDTFLAALDEALRHRELVKIKFDEFKGEKKTLAPLIAEKTRSRLVSRVGNTAVYYRGGS
jgi:RNA-binding protein